jgi:hypothetical protein
MHGAEHLVNASLLTDRFGPQTSFHDAEVLHVELSRGQNVVVRMDLYMFAASEELDERGCFQRENASVVTFIFQGVHELTLVDFNEQNVLQDLAFSRREDSMLLVEIFFVVRAERELLVYRSQSCSGATACGAGWSGRF